jgi:aspartate-semialdehyde dehydrogenase
MSGQRGLRVALLGATGAVGSEILEVLGERRLPVTDLLPFASFDSEGGEIEFRGQPERVRAVDAELVAGCDLVICAAPLVLRELLPALAESGTRVVDLSGVLEADPSIPLWASGSNPAGRWIAVPRGIASGLLPALGALTPAAELTRVTLTTLEPASGAGRSGAAELAEQTATLLGGMTGDLPEAEIFPRALAFDCLPLVGEAGAGGESSAELGLRQLLRRGLAAPALPIELTRVRVPTLSGSLATVNVALSHALAPARAAELWRKQAGLKVLDADVLPTPRAAVEADAVLIGRVRTGREDAPALAFAVAIDDLRRGAALPAVEAAERLLAR